MSPRPGLRAMRLTTTIVLLACATAPAIGQTPPTAVPDFCFMHISDSHFSPVPFGTGRGGADRGSDVIAWLVDEAAKPQSLTPFSIETPPPAFVAATGDITEYGVINETWDAVERLFKPLAVPFYVTPGNHDNTWTAIQPVMRQRYKSDHYSFDRFGCHFAFINTATPQEPLPSIEQRTLTWLRKDLDKVAAATPVFIFFHHPLSSGEFASPYEQLRLIEILENSNVVLTMMGHGHGARHERWGTIDSVMGGSTYGAGAGYGVISVIKGVLRSTYRYHDSSKPMAVLIEKPIAPISRATLDFLTVGQPIGAKTDTPTVRTSGLAVRVRVSGGLPKTVTASIDGDEKAAVKLEVRETPGLFSGHLPLGSRTPGMHYVRVTADMEKYKIDRAREFTYLPKNVETKAQSVGLPEGIKAGLLAVGPDIIACTTGGRVVKLSFTQPQLEQKVLLNTGVEILHTPAVAGDTLYVSSAEKGVYAVSLAGRESWQWTAPGGAAVYGTPAIDDSRVYVGDLEGLVHAIDRKSGKGVWSKRHAQFSIEQPLLLHRGRLHFGAWDGLVYCVDAKEGTLVWKKPGPAGHLPDAASKSRYYAPADSSPVIVGDRLFVCDRAHRFGSYSPAGEYLGEIAKDVSCIGLTADKKGLYARGLTAGVARYDGTGKAVWTNNEVLMGRFPAAPVESAGRVYACSNRGLLSVLDAATGKILWRYQVTPQLHVMAGLAAVGKEGVCAAGMNGTVTYVSAKDR